MLNKNTMTFNHKGDTYRIGGRMFPVKDRASLQLFDNENTSPIQLSEKFIAFFNMLDFKIGHAYSNTQSIYDLAKENKIDIGYYSGWLFIGESLPIHHAWCVVNQVGIIDPSVTRSELDLMKKINYHNLNWRDKLAKDIVDLRRKRLRMSEDCVFGKVPEEVVYVGCEDDIENARKIFRDLIYAYPNHICYRSKMNPIGESDIQKRIKNFDQYL